MHTADLHIHTTFSDGQHTPSEVVQMAKNKDINVISITDHDTIGGIQAGCEAAKKLGINFITGVELSCNGNPEAHILGYNFDIHNQKIIDTLSRLSKDKADRNLQIIDFLHSNNIHITLDEIQAVEPTAQVLGKPHIAQVLLSKGYISVLEEAYDKYLDGPEYKAAVKRNRLENEEGIALILQAGGIPVLAHPGILNLEPAAFERYLDNLISNGLRGLECYYSEHSIEQTNYFVAIAQARNLLVTGGSDFHGEKYKPGLQIGSAAFHIDKSILYLLGGIVY